MQGPRLSLKFRATLETIVDFDQVMIDAGLEPRLGFDDFGMQSDGSIIICDKCGNFGYLDEEKYCVYVSC